MSQQHMVRLTTEERAELRVFIATGVASAHTLQRARILLKADRAAGGRAWTDVAIAEALDVSSRTVARVRADWATGGVTRALARKASTRVYARRLDGAGEAQLIALACSPPPDGHVHWTARLLADRLVQLEVVSAIAAETVRLTLKKPPQAVADPRMVFAERGECRLRGRHGGCPRRLSPATRSRATIGLLRRRWQGTPGRCSAQSATAAGATRPDRQRLSAERSRQPLPVVCSPAGPAASHRHRATHPHGLGRADAGSGSMNPFPAAHASCWSSTTSTSTCSSAEHQVRHHPRGIPRRSRRRRRSRYGQDCRRSAPRGLLLYSDARLVTAGAACCSSVRTSRTWPMLRRAAQPRRGGRADLHPARPRRRRIRRCD